MQNALAWRLRTAISLASLWRQMDRLPEAMTLLSSIYSLFSEGHSSADLRRAQRLLETL
jgi:predicted ATPase